MDVFTYLMAKKGQNTGRDLFSYLLGKGAGGGGTYTTFSGISLNISNTVFGKIKNFMLNSTELTQENKILPEGYTQVDYIQSSGTQYIDTGVIPTINTKIESKFNLITTSQQIYSALFGTQNQNDGRPAVSFFVSLPYQARFSDDVNFNTITTNVALDTNIHNISLKFNELIMDNIKYTGSNTFNATIDYSIYIFARNYLNTPYETSYAQANLYKMKIYENNVLIRNFVPCYRNSDNEVGLFDIVNNVFYVNQGTGTFNRGNNVIIPNPDNPVDVNVIKGENTINICNENIWDEETQIGYYAGSTGEYVPATGQLCSKNFINVKPNTTYYFVTPIVSGNGVRAYDKNKNYIESLDNNVSSFTTGNNCYYIKINLGSIYGGTYNNDVAISLNSTKYVEHQEQNYPISLGTLEYCKIGNYADQIFKNTADSPYYDNTLVDGEWYLKKNIGKAVLDGSETNWDRLRNYVFRFTLDAIYPTSDSDLMQCFCDKFPKIASSATWNNYDYMVSYQKSNKKIVFRNIDTLTLDDWENWLSTNNIIFYYILATPTYTQISQTNYPTLRSQLEDIYNNSKSYNGQTNITQTNDDLPFNISLDVLIKEEE